MATSYENEIKQLGVRGFLKNALYAALFIFVTAGLLYIIYHFTFARHFGMLWGGLGIWLVIAYITIPRIHRWLTKLYLPNYYIGRSRTGDGLLGDPVNIAFFGSKQQIIDAMIAAGWTMADELGTGSSLKMIKSSITKKSYPTAPVSSLFLFNKKQDFAFQQEVGGTTSKRHHIRFWQCPKGWYLPGGYQADWLAAGTYDRSVGFSLFTFQVTHKIEANIDQERDFVILSLQKANKVKSIKNVEHFSSSYHDRNGGGDLIKTDGMLPFVTIQ